MSVCGICNLDLSTKPRTKNWDELFQKYPKLKGYFGQPEDKVDIPISVDIILTTCKAQFHNICITEWLMMTKSLTCPACKVVMPFAEMRKKHFKVITENMDPLCRVKKLEIKEVASAASVASVASAASSSNGIDNNNKTAEGDQPADIAAKGDFRSGKVQPTVIQSEILHNHKLTQCTTYLYSGKSKLLEELETSDPDTNDESDWGVPPPWSLSPPENAIKDEPLVFNLTPYHSRGETMAREADFTNGGYSTSTESDSYESLRSNSLEGNVAM